MKLPIITEFYNSIHKVPVFDKEFMDTTITPLFSRNYLEVLEETQTDVAFGYIVFRNSITTEVLGFSVVQNISLNSEQIASKNFPCKVSYLLRKYILKSIKLHVLVCGSLFACGENGFFFNKQKLPPQQAYRALGKALLETAKTHFEYTPSLILVKEFFQDTFKDSDFIRDQGFVDLSIDVNMSMFIDDSWYTFEDYKQAIRSKFRNKLKNVYRASSSINIRSLSVQEIRKHTSDINRLYASVVNKAYFKLGKLNTLAFEGFKKNLDEQFIFTGFFETDKLIGFTTAIHTQETIEAFHIGFEEKYKKSHSIYQRMLYYFVELAIDKKATRLQLGRTSETIKSNLGATPLSMKLYIRHRNRFLNWLLSPIPSYIEPNDFEQRNPFKRK